MILVLFCALGVTYSAVTPIFEASDELWHYPVVQYIAAGHGLPVQTSPGNSGPWKQEASQPPLYYALSGLLTAWIDTGDPWASTPAEGQSLCQMRPNPHAAAGVVTPDGNINLVVHDPACERWPWRGTSLAVHLARLLSVALGAASVYLTYRLGREAFPGRPDIALGAAALNAFTPMFLFISGSVNNDNLVIPLCALALLIMIRQSKPALAASQVPDPRRGEWGPGKQEAHHAAPQAGNWEKYGVPGWLILGTLIGLAALSKVNALALLPLAALTGMLAAWQRRNWRYLFVAGLAIGLPVLVLTGWWFWRNVRLYGDALGFSLFLPYFTRAIPADLAQIWSERTSFLYGYWGNLGGLNLPIPEWAYVLFNALLLLAAAGAVKLLVTALSNHLPVSRVSHTSRFTDYVSDTFPLLLISLWAIVVFMLWLNWTHTTWSSQGRLVFSAIPSYSILIVAGLAALLPRRVAPYAFATLGVGMVLLAAALPFSLIAPAYARPPQLAPAQEAAMSHRLDVSFGDPPGLVLLGYDAPDAAVRPGDSIPITLYWQALKPLDRDYSVFVHLLDENDIEVQDKGPAYPGRGRLPTTTLAPGQTWAETWSVPVHATAYTPARLTWEVGLYDAVTGERLPATNASGHRAGDSTRFGHIALARPPGSSFNPVAYNFGDQVELVGFELDRRAAMAGDTVTLSLIWRAPTAPARDYTVFVHVLQLPQTKWAGLDQQPAPPTSSWKPGQIVSATYPLTLDAATPPGVYEIEVGVYYFSDSSIERLKVLTRDGRQQQDYVLLNKLRVTR